ncbi:hypothetical protein PUNSTDRAFT_24969, partial [Punctularia strigosozonata HHB-11173 SS5]|uniref:uncharacterized protein n=1 Tax=Punctularia strigosozonata (strain HHB-11173) TaxID=741275 RepID=UPI0004417C5C
SDSSMDTSGSSASESSSSSGSSEQADDYQPLSQLYLRELAAIQASRYMNEREAIIKTPENIQLLLHQYKVDFPDIFRSFTGISPACFDNILCCIGTDPAFHNNSNNPQMPVDQQLAIALYRFRHFGNAVSVLKVALWAGVSVGTVIGVTKHVMAAVCGDSGLRHGAIAFPDAEAKEKAKSWVETMSCSGWRDGWLMVDGTLIPLYERPAFFGNTWYDRKSNYSMNLQLVSTPDLQIIDYSVGLPGSQHDSTAWAETRIYKEHEKLLNSDEWVWGDSAYPLETWCQAPYKK